jgi:hypothetical protein
VSRRKFRAPEGPAVDLDLSLGDFFIAVGGNLTLKNTDHQASCFLYFLEKAKQ